MPEATRKMQDYVTRDSLEETVGKLADPSLQMERDRAEVNDLTINAVIKYIAAYLKVDHTDMEGLKERVKEAFPTSPERILNALAQMVHQQANPEFVPPVGSEMALENLVDIRSTAALFKEIAFETRYLNQQDFVGIDLGHGTGILTLAMVISARRRDARKILAMGLDLHANVVQESRRVLHGLFKELIDREELVLTIAQADICRPDLWDVFEKPLPLHFVVSETVPLDPAPFVVSRDGLRFADSPDRVQFDLNANRKTDPFALVLNNALQGRRSFYDDVRARGTALFPDAVNGLFVPDRARTTLQLRSSNHGLPVLLNQTGLEFSAYEDFDLGTRVGRWANQPIDFKAIVDRIQKARR